MHQDRQRPVIRVREAVGPLLCAVGFTGIHVLRMSEIQPLLATLHKTLRHGFWVPRRADVHGLVGGDLIVGHGLGDDRQQVSKFLDDFIRGRNDGTGMGWFVQGVLDVKLPPAGRSTGRRAGSALHFCRASMRSRGLTSSAALPAAGSGGSARLPSWKGDRPISAAMCLALCF